MANLSEEEKMNIIKDESGPIYDDLREILNDKRAASVLLAISAYMAEFTLSTIHMHPGQHRKDEALSVINDQTIKILDTYLENDPELAAKIKK